MTSWSAPWVAAATNRGAAYVSFGRTTGFPATLDPSALLPPRGGDGSEGFVLTGETGGDLAGNAVSSAGDVNADGIADLLIGAKSGKADGSYAGRAYLVFGQNRLPGGLQPRRPRALTAAAHPG